MYNVLFFKIENAFSKMQKDHNKKNYNSSETITFYLKKSNIFNSI